MKKALMFFTCILFFSSDLLAQNNKQESDKPSALSAILFKDIKTKMTHAEKNEIAQKSGLLLSKDKKRIVLEDETIDYSVNVYPVDLNKDGKEELFILESSGFFGAVGMQFSMYIKDANGKYQAVLEKTIGAPALLTSIHKGYHDVLIGGPGFEFPVWRFDGKVYKYHRMVRDGTFKMADIAETSQKYSESWQ